ncbi:hypothetical protein [Streptomyces sp. NPDC020965]|uniref:hypothetical protein n=1 Tax=Streptomyces sp. NPDC020965 TaxID=3365105 RepID=UPI0037B3CFF1
MEPAASEACRLLCAGAHIDGRFRTAVIDELYVHEERFTAPSFGFDAGRVLAHALYARRLELGWALATLVLWMLAIPLTKGLILLLLLPCVLLALAPWIRGRSDRPHLLRRAAAFVVRWYGRLGLFIMLVTLVLIGLPGEDDEVSGDGSGDDTAELLPGGELFGDLLPSGGGGGGLAWLTLFLFVLVAVGVGLQRHQSALVMLGPLSAARFPHVAADPAENAPGGRVERLKALIRHEQHSPMVMYHTANPFRGSGAAIQTWTLAVELRPRKDRKPDPVDNRAILERVRKLVGDLREPSAHGSPEAAEAVRDRLRELRIDECVFLPADGISSRSGAPYDEDGFAEHRAASVEEGGEARRHFLRIRVGGWEEEVVVTIFVRVHTQGGMLMLEVAPHVLPPVDRGFREAERQAHQYLNNSVLGKASWAVSHAPGSLGQCLLTVGRYLGSVRELATGGHAGALPDGPALSIREIGADSEVSLFQDMDVMRYLKSIQDRVAGGVKVALFDAGWQTAEFEQKVINVSGGVYIDSANNSAFGFGDQSTATTTNTTSSADTTNRGASDDDS